MEFNYSAVTGACLLVNKKKFDEIGGFDETFPVAYNDVDLCFKLYEHGYYNVVRNDVHLYHHESVSRGLDAMDQKKLDRLKNDREHLYELHPRFKEEDPFFNKNMMEIRFLLFCKESQKHIYASWQRCIMIRMVCSYNLLETLNCLRFLVLWMYRIFLKVVIGHICRFEREEMERSICMIQIRLLKSKNNKRVYKEIHLSLDKSLDDLDVFLSTK